MIKYFTVENFRSIKNENILEFDTDIPENSDFVSNPVIGFAGANASGKTTILQALTFVLWFMQNSFFDIEEDEDIPIESFCTRQEDPIFFHLTFAIPTQVDNQIKQVDYEYKLHLTPQKVLYEQLRYAPIRKGSWRKVYKRVGNQVEHGDSIREIQTRDLRQNASIISFAAQFASQEIAKICKNYGFFSNVYVHGFREPEFTPHLIKEMLDNAVITQNQLHSFLQIADVGIRNVFIQEANQEEIQKILQAMKKDFTPKQIDTMKTALSEAPPSRAIFEHNIDNQTIEFETDSESSGTRRFLAILYLMLNALKNGDVIILDEIELKLHQNLVAYFIGLFQNKYENSKGAQLIFSFHNSYLMEMLTPRQLWFAEKNDEGHTELFSAQDFEDLRNLQQRNLETLYRIGRFGAKPRGI